MVEVDTYCPCPGWLARFTDILPNSNANRYTVARLSPVSRLMCVMCVCVCVRAIFLSKKRGDLGRDVVLGGTDDVLEASEGGLGSSSDQE